MKIKIKELPKKAWNYLKQDSWHSWLVSIILLYLIIRLVFFPVLALLTGSPLPIVVVESCSMYHQSDFDAWWATHGDWYESRNISKEEFKSYSLKNGLNKGDIIFVVKKDSYEKGDIIIFRPNEDSSAKNPTIHRVIEEGPLGTKGDNNLAQLTMNNNEYKIDETSISDSRIIGKSVFKIPFLGWLKLIFFEPFRPQKERGFCVENQKFKIPG